jgi:hypothetical protein
MNIKYIGMDVHKETISIAVMNGEGRVVMESIIETKASTILQCIEGIHGDLHLTLEEGTWAAWLYDLLKPHVTELVVCDPRKNALMKEGNKSDKIDARKLADLLRGGYLRSVYHGENGLRTLKELARSYLTISKDLTRVMNRVKALYRSWGIVWGGATSLRPASSRGVVGQDRRSGRAPASRVFLPTTRCSASVTAGSAEGSVGRESETERDQITAPGSFDRPDPSRSADRADPDPASVSQQATTVDIQRTGDQYARQCATPLRGRTTATFEEAPASSWAQSKS